MFGGSGSFQSVTTVLKNNKRITGRSANRYKKVKEQYIGSGNKKNFGYLAKLTKEQKEAGRKRAISYARRRNSRISIQIGITLLVVLSIVALLLWFVLGDGLTSLLDK